MAIITSHLSSHVSPGIAGHFGKSASLSPLQAATLGAWDMQEASGPLLPAAGDITITAFNAPGTAAGPGLGFSARECLAASSQGFGTADTSDFVLRTDRTLRLFVSPASGGVVACVSQTSIAGLTSDSWVLFCSTLSAYVLYVRSASGATRAEHSFTFSGVEPNDFFRVELTLGAPCYMTNVRTGETKSSSVFTECRAPLTRFLLAGRGNVSPVGNFISARYFGLALFDRHLTADERAADVAPRLYVDY